MGVKMFMFLLFLQWANNASFVKESISMPTDMIWNLATLYFHKRSATIAVQFLKWHTKVLLFICQCWSCSRGLLQWLPLSASGIHESMSIGSLKFSSSMGSFSLRVDKVLQSSGLQRPKSESFMWPFMSRRRLSGLMSLGKKWKTVNNSLHTRSR